MVSGPMRFIQIICTLAFLFGATGSVVAQTSDNSENAEEKPKILVLPPAYNQQMMRLAEVLGSLHYLRELCGADEGQLWRAQMEELIRKEEPSEDRKAQMIARFNQGFRGFRETYRECTDAAVEANKRYLAEGEKLSQDIPSRFGR